MAPRAGKQVLGAYSNTDKTKFLGRVATKEDAAKAVAAKKAKADERAKDAVRILEDMGLSLSMSSSKLAKLLTEKQVKTPSGRSKTWQTTTVTRLKERLR